MPVVPSVSTAASPTIDLGDTVTLTYPSLPVGSTAVTITITLPDGTSVTASAPSGIYTYVPTQAGRYTVQWAATGSVTDAYADAFNVQPAAPGYIMSLADAKSALRMTNPTAQDVDTLRMYLAATTRVVEHYVGPVVPKTCVERLTAVGGTFYLRNAPAISVTSMVTVQGTDLTPLYVLNAPAGLLEPLPQAFGGFFGNFAVEPFYGGTLGGTLAGHYANWPTTVTYQAGRIVVPDDILVAAGMILQEFWRSRRAGVSMKSVDTPTDQTQDMGQGLPDEAIALLANYPRVRGIY